MRAFDIGGMLTKQSLHLVRIPIDHLCMHGDESATRALFDDWQIVPVCARLLVCRRSASPCVFRDAAPRLQHCLAVAAFPIGGHRWRRCRVTTLFELGHQLECHFFLRFGNGSSNSQPTVYRDRRATPEAASALLFAVPPFSPLWPT